MDDLRDDIARLRDELRDLRIYTRSLEHELDRRGDWLINSIWGVQGGVVQLIILWGMFLVLTKFEDEGWVVKGAIVLLTYGAWFWAGMDGLKRQESDKRRIRRDSMIDRP